MARLPTPGSDEGNWGEILNDFLSVEHKPDGSLKIRSGDNLNLNNGRITALADPISAQDAATKQYVDNNIGSGGSPGGLDGQLQYNNNGAFEGADFLTIDNIPSPKRLATTGSFYIASDGQNGVLLDGAQLPAPKGVWNIKQGNDGTFLFDQSGGMDGRFKLGDAGSSYYDFTPDFSNSVLKIQGDGVVTTANNTLDDGSGGLNAVSYFVGGVAGASGVFTTNDGKTVTVTNGLITAIV